MSKTTLKRSTVVGLPVLLAILVGSSLGFMATPSPATAEPCAWAVCQWGLNGYYCEATPENIDCWIGTVEDPLDPSICTEGPCNGPD